MAKYKKPAPQATTDADAVAQTLNALILRPLSQLLPELVEQEISKRHRPHDANAATPCRNGYHKPRLLTCGCGGFSFQLLCL